MKHTPLTISVLKANLDGLSWEARAVLLAAYILGTANAAGECSIAELRGVFSMKDDAEFERIYAELHETCAAYKISGDELDTNMSHDLLPFAVGVPGRPKQKDWEKLKSMMFGEWFEHCEPHCMYCHATGVDLTLDHAQPVSRGGSNHPRNFIAACHPCNTAKRNKTFAEFMAWRKERGL